MGFIDHLIDHLAQMTTFEYRRPFGVVIVLPRSNDHGRRHSAGIPSRRKRESARVLGSPTGHPFLWREQTEDPMQRCMTRILTGVIVLCGTPAAEAVSPGRMISSMQSGMCPEDASAVVIYSKDPFCAFYHLTGDQCQHNWKEYWKLTAQYNEFLEHCRMEKKVGHLQ